MSGIWSHSQTARCPVWEDRLMRPKNSSHRVNGHVAQVRCSRRRKHDGEHIWKGIPFGVHDVATARVAPLRCGAERVPNRARPEPGACQVFVLREGERCRFHR